MMSDFFYTVISSAAVSALLTGLLVWMAKTWIGERMKNAIKAEYDTRLESHKAVLKADTDRQIETHKAQLKASADVEIERLKSSLSIAAAERATTFSHLQNRRADVIAKAYSLLMQLHASVADYVKAYEAPGEASREERGAKVKEASEAFTPYFEQNRIFLTKAATLAVQEVNRELIFLATRFSRTVEAKDQPDVDAWMKITEKFYGSVATAISELEREFRMLLGDNA